METSTELEEVVYEESETFSEIISSSTYAYQMVDTIDTVMLSDEDREILDRLVNDGSDNKTSNYSL